jgi:cold shock CspA family protein
MLLSWDYEYYDEEGRRRSTVTSTYLWDEVTYPVAMQDVIENATENDSFPVNRLFVEKKKQVVTETAPAEKVVDGETMESEIFSLKDGYGFISYPQTNNLFFHYSFLIDTDFNDLREGDSVEFTISKNEKGDPVAKNVRLIK